MAPPPGSHRPCYSWNMACQTDKEFCPISSSSFFFCHAVQLIIKIPHVNILILDWEHSWWAHQVRTLTRLNPRLVRLVVTPFIYRCVAHLLHVCTCFRKSKAHQIALNWPSDDPLLTQQLKHTVALHLILRRLCLHDVVLLSEHTTAQPIQWGKAGNNGCVLQFSLDAAVASLISELECIFNWNNSKEQAFLFSRLAPVRV